MKGKKVLTSGITSQKLGRVFVAATNKGGAGKSTTIACLSLWWHQAGYNVALLDGDPNQTLTRWHSKGNALSQLPLVSETNEDLVVEAIERMAATNDLVMVDCPGFASTLTLFVLSSADFVIIPAMCDEANVFEAQRMRRMIQNAARLTRRRIPSRTLLSRVKRSSVAEHSYRQLVDLEAEPLNSRLTDRSIFQEASFHGSAPVVLDPKGIAAKEVRSLAEELETLDWWGAGPPSRRNSTLNSDG